MFVLYSACRMKIRPAFVTDGKCETQGSEAEAGFPQPAVWAQKHVSVVCAVFYFIAMTEENAMKKVGIIMGSDSDLPIVQKAIDVLKELSVPYEAHIYSAHRSPKEAAEFATNAADNGFGVLIAAAGMAAHLAGALAANTVLPVIGIPCSGAAFGGMDALLSTVQMPSGIPVATVAVNGGANAALLAAQILAVNDAALTEKLAAKRKNAYETVLQKDCDLQQKLL